MLGPHATGLYNLGKRVTTAISLMIGARLSRVASSMFYRHSTDAERLRVHFTYMAGLTLAGLVPFYGLLANLAEPVPADLLQLLEAMQGNREAMSDFISMLAGVIPAPQFFGEKNVARIMAQAGRR